MRRLKRIIIKHKTAIALAVFASIIVAFPQVYFRIDHKEISQEIGQPIYQGIELLPDSPWSARVREVQDGHPNFGSIYYKDGKNNPYLFQPLGSMVVGYMGKIFSLDINNTLLLSRLILTFTVFLLIYGFVFLFSRDKLVALSSASVLLLAESVLSLFGIKQLVHGISPDDFLRIARPVNPAMIYVLFFGFLSFFYLFYKKTDKRWLYGIASAVLLGLNFYNYFYTWTYLYAFGSILVLIFLIRKKWKDALKIGSVFLGGVLLAIPYGINLYGAMIHNAYVEAGLRNGIIQTHAPIFIGFTVITALIFFLLWFPKENKNKYFFGLAFLVTPFVTMNQQLITGKLLQVFHYHWFFHKPIAVIFILIIIFYILNRKNLIFCKNALAILIIGASFAVGAFIQTASYYKGDNDGGNVAIERQKYGPVMKWLNEHAEKEAVVFANNEISHITVIYTSLNVFYHRAGMYSLSATKERLLNIIFSFYQFRGIGIEDARETFFAERGYLSSNIYGMHYREFLGSYDAIPDEKIEEILEAYIKTLSIPTIDWLKETLAKYEVEYVVWDKKNDPDWRLEQYLFLREVAVFGNMVIYQFKKNENPISTR